MRRQYEVLARETVYQGFFRLSRLRLRHRWYRGGWSPEITRELLERGRAVAVLPYDPGRDRVVLIEQFRVGAIDTEPHPWVLEIVSGMAEEGEGDEDVARRETSEEAGLEIGTLTPIGRFLSSVGGSSESTAVYLAEVDTASLPEHAGAADEHEDIRVLGLSRRRALGLLEAGRIVTPAAVIALQWLALHR